MNGVRLFDCHCDTISRIFDEGGSLYQNSYHIDLEKASVFSEYAQVFALWGDMSIEADIEKRFSAQLSLARKLLNGQNGAPVLCKSARDMDLALEGGRPAAFLAAEGAELLGCSPETLKYAFGEGLRFVTLTWNNRNQCASSAAADETGGLTSHGKAFVKHAEELGVILDVSHLSERGFYDLAECSGRPFIASHSNARAVLDHRRNLKDEQLKVLIRREGICGINLYTRFLEKDAESCTIDTVIRHIEHVLSLGGEHILALGCDFDGCDSLPQGISSVADLRKLYEALIKRNYKKTLVDRIFFGNMARFVQKNLAGA